MNRAKLLVVRPTTSDEEIQRLENGRIESPGGKIRLPVGCRQRASQIRYLMPPSIDQDRLLNRLREMAEIGRRDDGGVDRQAFTPEDAQARRLMVDWAAAAGLETCTDAVGNLFMRHVPDGRAHEAPIMSGSHLDTQPAGGWLDGAYGVVAALEVLVSLKESGAPLDRPLEAVAWVNEEGSRFLPGMIGSASYVGHLDIADIEDNRDAENLRLGDAIRLFREATPDLPLRSRPSSVAAYVELHIEQGPILEAAGVPIGVVSGVQGYRVFELTVRGRTAHAGTTPHSLRRDAVRSAVGVIQALQDELSDAEEVTRFTVGRLSALPGSPSSVADEVVFTIDLRHPDKAVLDRATETIPELASRVARPCSVDTELVEVLEPVEFDETVTDVIAESATASGYTSHCLLSGAGHDAALIATCHPAGMIFVPCFEGISHHPDEDASDADLIAGAVVLAEAMKRLAQRSDGGR